MEENNEVKEEEKSTYKPWKKPFKIKGGENMVRLNLKWGYT